MFNEYPYTDYHELNTDWIIGKIKNVETAETNTKEYSETAEAAKDRAVQAEETAVDAKDKAVLARNDAVHAKETAVNIVADTNDQIALLQARVDNIIPDGTQTVGNTELLDIRVGADGTIYDSAGDAVRGQYTDLKDDLATLGTWSTQNKNKLMIEDSAGRSGWWGVTWTCEDGILKVNGVTTGNIVIKVSNTPDSSVILENSWKTEETHMPLNVPLFLSVNLLSGSVSDNNNVHLSGYRTGGNPILTTSDPTKNGISITTDINYFVVAIKNGTTLTNAEFGLQIEVGTSATSYINCYAQQFYPNNGSSRIKIVDKNNATAFYTIQDAIDACEDGDEIIVYPDSYEEHLDMGTKFIHLHGMDPVNTVVWNDIGDYDYCPLWVGNALVEGITFHAVRDPGKDYSGIDRGPYAVHLDQRWGGNRTVIFRNCHFYNDFGGEIGTGVIDNVHIIIDNCYAEDQITNSNVMQIHGDETGTGYAYIDIMNCTFKCVTAGNGRGILFSNGGPSHNVGTKFAFKINNSFLTRFYNSCGALFELDDTSYGNNIAELNN